MSTPSSPSGLSALYRTFLLLSLLLFGWWAFHQGTPPLSPEMKAAETALKAKEVAKAREQFDKALNAHPGDLTTYMNILQLCQDSRQWGLMLQYTQTALTVFKDADPAVRADLNLKLATAYESLEPTRPRKNTLYAVQTASQLDPQNPIIQNAYGYLLADNDQNLDEAYDLIQKALKAVQTSSEPAIRQQLPAVEDSYGWVLYKKGRWKEAAEMLLKALYDYPEGMPGDALKVSYYHLGATYRLLEKFDEARQALRSALYYDADYADAKAEMARIPQPADSTEPLISPSPSPLKKN